MCEGPCEGSRCESKKLYTCKYRSSKTVGLIFSWLRLYWHTLLFRSSLLCNATLERMCGLRLAGPVSF